MLAVGYVLLVQRLSVGHCDRLNVIGPYKLIKVTLIGGMALLE